MTNILTAEMWLCDIGHSIVCQLGGSDSSQQQQQQSAQNFANSSTGNQVGQYANGAVNAGQLQGALNEGQGLYQNGNALTNAGLASVNTGANAGSDLFSAADPALTNTLNGSLLSAGNPYFGQMVSQVGDAIRPQIDGQFAAAGRYGSGANANAYADALSREAGNLAYQNYGQERTNQLGAISQLPSYAQGLTVPGQAQMTAGYAPLNQYIQQLSTLKPGTLGSYGQNSNSSSSGTSNSSGIGTGDSSTFGVSTSKKQSGSGGN